MPRSRLLLLDDPFKSAPGAESLLAREGWELLHAASPEAAALLEREPVSMLLLDLQHSGEAGIRAVQELRHGGVDLPVVLFQHGGAEKTGESFHLSLPGAVGILDGTIPLERWPETLSRLLTTSQREKHKFTAADLFADILADIDSPKPASAPAMAPPPPPAPSPAPLALTPPEPVPATPADPPVQKPVPFAFNEFPGIVDPFQVSETVPDAFPAPLPPPPPPPLPVPPPAPAPAVEALEEFGNYYLLEKIAVGGMAELFKARQRGVHNFEKIVAIKRILPHLSDNDEFVRMFIDEAKLAAQLTHPNIVQIFDLGKAGGFYYIAMEHVDGKDLRDMLRKVREHGLAFPEPVAAFIAMKVAGALDYAHRKKGMNDKELRLVHRDISPQNILVSSHGAVKLVDFGIAKAATKTTQTVAGALKGKLLYMSPEQALAQPVDNRSDLYSLGLVLFELLTGERCFQADSELGVLEKVRLGRVQNVRRLNPAVSEEMAGIVERLLRKEVDQRYPSARLLERDLKALLSRTSNEPVEHDIAEFSAAVLTQPKDQIEALVAARFAPPAPKPPPPPAPVEPPTALPPVVESPRPTMAPPDFSISSSDGDDLSKNSSKWQRILPFAALAVAILAILLWLIKR
ncbi:MAG: protein kinase [Firmicutes bacterium]|nr:protein kinase [Bacillota bacterium]